MDTMIVITADFKSKFVKWFNNRYGWFFTNGYKAYNKAVQNEMTDF